jgi:hypothetical protein
MYSTEALERGIEAKKKNIKVFEKAIEDERKGIEEYYGMIDVLKQKKREAEALERLGESINADPGKLLH